MKKLINSPENVVTEAERASVAVGLETVCVELAARFCVDVFEDRSHGWICAVARNA